MGKYLKLFDNHALYEAFTQTEDFILPNVSHCIEENHVHYNPLTPPPMNIIRYEASEKLTETTSDKSSGLHTNKFGTTMVSHTFENGVGTIEFEDDVTTFGSYAFYNCGNMTSIDIPNSVTSIGQQAFQSCSGLTSVTIPDSVTSIGDTAFVSCSGLTSVTIPDSVTSIGQTAFSNCSSLTSVTIGSGVTNIDSMAFYNCVSLESIVVNNSNTTYDSRNNCNAIIETAPNTLISGCKNTIIPEGVISIGSQAFGGCSSLTNVTIPDSVTSIGQGAFSDCSGLTSVTIPDSVTSIGGAALYGCSGLTSITIPNSVTSIGQNAFRYCTGLTSITVEAITPPTLGSGAFDNTNNCPIYVPAESVNTYKDASGWTLYASKIQAIPTT